MVVQPGSSRDQQSATSASDLAESQALRELVVAHLNRQQHAQTTAELIETIFTKFPGCPRAQSYWVDRLMEGDAALAEALREQEGI